VVYGVMRTADGVSAHSARQLGISLPLFVVVYFVVFGTGVVYLLHLIAHGPQLAHDEPPGGPGQLRQGMRPLSAADHTLDDATEDKPATPSKG